MLRKKKIEDSPESESDDEPPNSDSSFDEPVKKVSFFEVPKEILKAEKKKPKKKLDVEPRLQSIEQFEPPKRVLRENVEKELKNIKNDPSQTPITDPPLREIKAVNFGIMSPEEIQGISVCKITKSKITPPYFETVYDERMGPSDIRGICSTCSESLRVCPGHFGYIDLSIPVIHPQFAKYLISILNCVCLRCSKIRKHRLVEV